MQETFQWHFFSVIEFYKYFSDKYQIKENKVIKVIHLKDKGNKAFCE